MNINGWMIGLGSVNVIFVGLGFIVMMIKLGKSSSANNIEEIKDQIKFQTKNIMALERLISMADETLKNQRSHTKLFEKLFSTQERLLTEIDKEV